jgi:hypothetical protein
VGRLLIAQALDAGKPFHVFGFDGIAYTATAHRDNERLDEGVDAVDRQVGAVVYGNIVAPCRGTGHR